MHFLYAVFTATTSIKKLKWYYSNLLHCDKVAQFAKGMMLLTDQNQSGGIGWLRSRNTGSSITHNSSW